MQIFNNDSPQFITIAGTIDELGGIQLLPMHQSADRPNLPKPVDGAAYSARLHYKGDGLLEQPVYSTSINACDTEKRIELEYTAFWVSLPLVKGADLVQLLKNDKVIFEQPIDTKPVLAGIDVKPRKDGIDISWQSRSKSILAYSAFLKNDAGMVMHIGSTRGEKKLSFNLEGFPDGGKFKVEIAANNGVLSSLAASKPFSIEPTAPLALIVTPLDGDKMASNQPISLIGNCYDAFGTQLDWAKYRLGWRVNGEMLSDGAPVALLKPLEPGKHKIEIVSDKWGVLEKSEIHINKPSSDFKRHEELFARLNPKKPAKNPGKRSSD